MVIPSSNRTWRPINSVSKCSLIAYWVPGLILGSEVQRWMHGRLNSRICMYALPLSCNPRNLEELHNIFKTTKIKSGNQRFFRNVLKSLLFPLTSSLTAERAAKTVMLSNRTDFV
jgi:hypothetical protein